jgi:NAD(P)H-nitrite reductase large subunit
VNLDDKICYCYHVPLRKLISFARRERIQRASQMSLCLGAGTGCGWCVPILKRIFEQAQKDRQELEASAVIGLPASVDDYAAGRAQYLRTDTKNIF